jgi:hypothetical protein
MKLSKGSLAHRLCYGECGQSLVLVSSLLMFLLGSSALVIDMGNLYFSYQELLSATQAAAKAGGDAMPSPTGAGATAVADLYSGLASTDYNYHSNLDITSVTVNYACVAGSSASSLNMPPCSTSPNSTNPYPSCGVTTGNPSGGCNAIQVTEKATVTTFLARVFGVKTLNISATASASASGGGAVPYHIMMVLDTTASMGNGTDTGCTASGSGSYSPEQCAQLGIQTLLQELAPCATNLASCGSNPAVDEVGLMVFPGLCSDTATKITTSNCPAASTLTNTTANSTYAPPDYACPSTAPPIAAYNNDPEYLLLGFQNNYRSSDTASLSFSSGLVDAIGGGTDNCGVKTPGGEGTFYAGAIVAAQTYLTANHTANVQDVMMLLSDGDASSSSTQMGGSVNQTVSSSKIAGMNGNLFSATAECTQAVNAANWAKGIKQSDGTSTEIYSISYGSESSGCTSGESVPAIAGNAANTPCATMAGIASPPLDKYFFSVPQTISGVTSTVCDGAVPITHLNQVFTTIAGDLSSSRLIPNTVF